MIGWSLKLLASVIFMIVFSYIYSADGVPYGDVGNFFYDSYYIAEYGKTDFTGYLKLLFGLDADNLNILHTHLAETNIWSAGDNGDFLNDNRLILRINSVIHFFSFGNIWVHVLIFSGFSFIGTCLIYRAFESLTHYKTALFYSLLLVPSFAFWGAGITKETLFVLAIGIFFYSVLKLSHKLRWSYLIVFLAAVLMLLFNKTHAGIIILPLALVIPIANKIGFSRKLWIGATSLLVVTIVCFSYTPAQINVVDRMSYKQQDLINLGKGGVFFITDSSFCSFDYALLDHFEYDNESRLIEVKKETEGTYKLFGESDFIPFTMAPAPTLYDVYLVIPPSDSYVDVPPIDHSGLQLVKNLPLAIVNVLVRPFPTDNGSDFKYLVFLENIGFLSFFAFVIYRRRPLNQSEKIYFYYLLTTAILLVLVIGWTTPILGAVARYKMVPQLFLLLSAFILLGPKRIKEQ